MTTATAATTAAEGAQEARPKFKYTVTMTDEQYGIVYGAILTAQIQFGAKAATATFDLAREFAAHDAAQADAAMAVLDSLNFKLEDAA